VVIPTGVSVALCTHFGERFITAQIASILSQTVLPDELVLSDDASDDLTLQRVREAFAMHASTAIALRVIVNRPPLGVTKNFEAAMLACSNDIVILSDQDDVWMPDRVERTLRAFEENPLAVLVHSDAQLIDAEGALLPGSLFAAYRVDEAAREQLKSGGAFDIFVGRNLVTGATAAVRKSLVQAAAPFPSGWVHDEWLAMVATGEGAIVPITERLVGYRQHGENAIGAVTLTTGAKLRRLVAPGTERNRQLLLRATELADRYPKLAGSTPYREAAVKGKLEHERVRSGLGRHRLARVRSIVRELRTGRYHRFGGGLQDVLRDLVQPLNPSR
jgi:hypothetical protein